MSYQSQARVALTDNDGDASAASLADSSAECSLQYALVKVPIRVFPLQTFPLRNHVD